jgi:tetratricopeptide (TPR) repeat protein
MSNKKSALLAVVAAALFGFDVSAAAQATNPGAAGMPKQDTADPTIRGKNDRDFASTVDPYQKGNETPGSALIQNYKKMPPGEFAKFATRVATNNLQAKPPNLEEAHAWLKAAIEKEPGYEPALILAGFVEIRRGKFDAALAFYETALKSNPKSFSALEGLGAVYYNLRDFAKAGEHYRRAINLEPKKFQPRLMAANSLFMQNQPEKAIAEFEQALAINPDSLDANYNIALCYLKTNNRDKALSYLAVVRKLDAAAGKKLETLVNGGQK